MVEVNNLKHEPVSDRWVSHLIKGEGVQTIDRKLYLKDSLNNIGVRININRDNYKVPPGLYKIGNPTKISEVIVTCNYKLTVDLVRSTVKKDYWLLIIDTDGINVWCAAGKGRFGTAEVIYSIQKCLLSEFVNHKRILLPQLAGPGIQSHIIKNKTGFNVKFGPVHIKDLDHYVETGYVKTDQMREVTFNIKERFAVMPLEWVPTGKLLLVISLLVLLLPFLNGTHLLMMVVSSFVGTVFVPLILPWRPFKMFYINGLISGALLNALILVFSLLNILSIGVAILGTALAGYQALNFTGSTTFTSLSGVKKEMEKAIPVLMVLCFLGGVLTIVGSVLEVLS